MSDERTEVLCDAMAELLFSLWQQDQDKQRAAAEAAPSVESPGSTVEANESGT